MFLLVCPNCRGITPVADDPPEVRCQECGLWVDVVERYLMRDPERVRWFVAKQLRPVGNLMLLFGIGQALVCPVGSFYFANIWSQIDRNSILGVVLALAVGAVLFVGGVLISAGGIALLRGHGRLYVVIGVIFALTSPFLLGFPLGVWAIRELRRPMVRAMFSEGVAAES